ncbi:fungal-specific transcription factor domain-containing protein, partial [Plectosphaerella plurivora]
KSCDACRKKKVRCEPTLEGCAQCTKYRTKCHFTPIATRRKPRRPAGFKYIAQLEERLSEVEGVLRDQSSAKQMLDTAPSASLDTSALTSGETSDPVFALEVADGPDFSTLGGFISDSLAVQSWPHPALEPEPVVVPASQRLPTKAAALELVNETFINYNRFLPLFNEADFMQDFQLKYSASNPGDAAWWACLNVVLSIAHRLRALRTSDPAPENFLAFGYLQNALGVITELNVSEHSLSAVRALVGMACILQGTSSPEPASMLVAAALRLAQAMDLHRESSNPSFTDEEAEKRRRVFWKAYILDKDISLRTGRPFSQDDDDMDVRLPSKTITDHCSIDIFNYRISLAVIQGLVYKRLYSIRAERSTESERAAAAQELSSLLSYWKSSAQGEDATWMLSGGAMAGEMIHHVVLRLTYIHCLTMIDRYLSPTTPSPSNLDLSRSDVSPPSYLCLTESRIAIRLITAIPHVDCSCVWMLLHAFFAAARSILINLNWDPTSSEAQSDLDLVKPVLRLLETLAGNSYKRSPELKQMQAICNSLNDEAKMAVQIFSNTSTAAPFGQ